MRRPVAVLRLIALLLVAAVTLQAAGASAFVGDQVCQESCPDDDADGDCAPFCDDCLCCLHPRSVMPPQGVNVLAPSMARTLPPFWIPDVSGLAHARGIEHIPKPFLA